MSTQDGGAAFPHTGQHGTFGECGMSLRDYFAAAALTGICSSNTHRDTSVMRNLDMSDLPDVETMSDEIATAAYWIAEAMLKAREK